MTEANGSLKSVLVAQLVWVALVVGWNITGVVMVNNGLAPPGPSTSVTAALLFGAIGVGLFDFSRKWPLAYGGLSAVAGALAIGAVYKPLTADPSLWASDVWRYTAVVINAIGIVSAIPAVIVFSVWWLKTGRHLRTE